MVIDVKQVAQKVFATLFSYGIIKYYFIPSTRSDSEF